MDCYEILGLEPSATALDIDTAYQREVSNSSPDTSEANVPTATRFQLLSAAYVELSDPAKRARYDADPHATTVAPMTFEDAWKVYICFVAREFVTKFKMGRDVLSLINATGLLALGMHGQSGCYALVAITLALTNDPEEAVGIYEELNEAGQTVFRMGVLLMARLL